MVVAVLVVLLLLPQNPHGLQYLDLIIARFVIIDISFAQFDIRRRYFVRLEFYFIFNFIRKRTQFVKLFSSCITWMQKPLQHTHTRHWLSHKKKSEKLFSFFSAIRNLTTIFCSTFKINQIATEMRRLRSEKNKKMNERSHDEFNDAQRFGWTSLNCDVIVASMWLFASV